MIIRILKKNDEKYSTTSLCEATISVREKIYIVWSEKCELSTWTHFHINELSIFINQFNLYCHYSFSFQFFLIHFHLLCYCGKETFLLSRLETIAIEKKTAKKVWKIARSMNWYFFIFHTCSLFPSSWAIFILMRELLGIVYTHLTFWFKINWI